MNPIRFPELFSGAVHHGFFTRQGGVSSGLFESLNVTPYSGDDIENVSENRTKVREHLKATRLITLKQTHSALCLDAATLTKDNSEIDGDALVTDQQSIAIGVMTADCAPVLFEGNKQDGTPVIGAAHAGWGGALKGICEATIDKMIELGADPLTIKAAIGPCIGVESYEVGENFINPFLEENVEATQFLIKKDGRPHFNLESYVEYRLKRRQIGSIQKASVDTYREENFFFSFRRATHRGEKEYGRQISAISIFKS
ncbi:MAG TPA: polyphenol oxidase family protein [Alphaproteobacteria bacterium]|nr:laccase domain-containing protein [Alphaproteobacteria bacterium]HOO51259.1 polyphenol oxidase family protein [Alphaproteobacteria bacterium]